MKNYNLSKQPLNHSFNPRIKPPNKFAYLALNYDINLDSELFYPCSDIQGDYLTEPTASDPPASFNQGEWESTGDPSVPISQQSQIP